jgi:Rrf2 family protein
MFHITRKADYAIRGMVFLADEPKDKVSLIRDISSVTDVSPALSAKIFQHLNKIGLVRSYRGAGGGFQLARPAKDISLLEIIEAVDGPIAMNRCIIEKGSCGRESYCSVHPVWKTIQQKMKIDLSRVSLQQLAKKQRALVQGS